MSFREKLYKGVYKLMAVIMIVTAVSLPYSNIFADSISDMQKELEKIQQQLKDNKNKLQGIEAEINNIKLEMVSLDIEIAKYNDEIAKMEEKMSEVEAELTEKEEKFKQATQQQDGAQKLLETRLRVMYENGFVNFWDILFSSGSFTDFLSKYSVITTILEYDKTMVDNLKNQKEYSENLKKEIEIKKVQQEQLKYDREKTAGVLKSKQNSKQVYMNQLESNQSYISQLNKNLQSQESALDKKIEEELAKLNNSGIVSEAGFLWPFPACNYISAGFNGYPGHKGMDIAPSRSATTEQKKIVAAKSGKVIAAVNGKPNTYPYLYDYGNYVWIDHGNGEVTIYGHLAYTTVSAGQMVKQGQQIGVCGNTGYSTGTHLHFEIRKGGKAVNPANYVVVP